MGYAPPPEQVERYADLLIGFALGGGAGIARGDVVHVVAPECAKPLYAALCRAVWRAGGHVVGDYRPDDDDAQNLSRDFFELAAEEQLDFFPARYRRGLIDECDHVVQVKSERNPHALGDVDPAKVLRRQRAFAPAIEWQAAKEGAGDFTWTIALYGTEEMAREAGLSVEEYWQQIIEACYLDRPDPKGAWREIDRQLSDFSAHLTELAIDRLHVHGPDADLRLTVGERRRWMAGGGRNIPSFEVFTSPDWRGTEGWVRFSEPLYVYGTLITGIELEFDGGRVVRASAEQNEPLLTELLATDGGDRLGEFSMTDARLSRITRFMANTLYDENFGGEYGNTHVALGRALHHCYDGDPGDVSDEEWERLGFNHSAIHKDIVTTSDRTVTATLADGSERMIYEGGRILIED